MTETARATMPKCACRFFGVLIFVFICAAFGCSTVPYAPAQFQEPQPRELDLREIYVYEPAVIEPAQLRYAVMPQELRPGYPITIGVNSGFGVETAALMLGERRLGAAVFFPVICACSGHSFYATLLTVPTTAGAGQATIVLETQEGPAVEIFVEIGQRVFRNEIIPVNQAPAGNSVGAGSTAEPLWPVLAEIGSEAHFFGAFVRPVEATWRTSPFGARRTFIGADGTRSSLIHAGIDYGVPRGTPVFASGTGRVVMSRYQRVAGNSVIIEHLPGVFSIYYHLDSMYVREGDIIYVGAVLGRSGNTGFTTGPHLHWEVRVFGEITDPDTLVARPLIDKAAILTKLGH